MRLSIAVSHLSTAMGQRPGAYWPLSLFACGCLVLLSIAFLDRPMAEFAHASFPSISIVRHVARLPDGLLALAIIAPFVTTLQAASRRPFRILTELASLCSFSVLWTACAVEFLLKRVFGRTGPGAWLDDHVYGFHVLGGYAEPMRDFPSGEAALVASVLSVLWSFYPRWRVLYAFAFCAESFLLVMLNWHFVSDVLAGGFVGASIGTAVTQLWKRRNLTEDN